MPAGRARRRDGGFTYLGVLFVVVLLGLGLAGASEVWSISSRRARERELLWVGNQYTRALKSYYMQSPGARQYPLRLDELLEDRRFPMPRRHLRQLYPDPVARSAEWRLILNAEGRIGGVASLSEETPLKQAGFPPKWEAFEGLTKYSDWRFVADINLLDVKKALPPGAAASSPR
ncbi:MAG TPA: type II secretion system protein [Ramlibacter sp.]|nr:type II secretion system protein [Ramlibacter sp.]